MRLPNLARIMHKFSTAATKSSALTAFRDPQAGTPGLLNVLQRVRLRWPPVVRGATHSGRALSSLRDENLCIILALPSHHA